MKTYEVTVNVPSKERDWCIYDEVETWVSIPTTTAILTARDEQHLKEKIFKHYGKVRILETRELRHL